MAVARTYEKYPIKGDPFLKDGKRYVKVETPKGDKDVRWYSDAERARMDAEAEKREKAKEAAKEDVMNFNARCAFGFGDAGYITIYKGDEDKIEEWASENHNCTRRNLTFGYYTPSHLEITNLPSFITPIKLMWEEVQDHDDRMKPHDVITAYVQTKLNGGGPDTTGSKFQGTVGNWIERDLAVSMKKSKNTQFGVKHQFTMLDANGNRYFWETGTKNFKIGDACKLKMKVKEHKMFAGSQTTVVWYCKEI